MATWTRSTTRPARTTGIVSSRACSPVARLTVSIVGAPRSALTRASGESGRPGRSARDRTRPSGSRSCSSASANSEPRNSRTSGSRSGGSGAAGSAGGTSRSTPATVKSEASRSLNRCQRSSEYAATLTRSRMATTTPEYQSVSRARIESGPISGLVLQDVAGSADRVEELLLLRPVDLAAQIADVHVDDVALGVEVEPPHVLDQHRPREDAAGVAHEVLEQRPLARGQLDPAAGPLHLARGRIERQVGQPQDRGAPLRAAPEQGAHSRQELVEREGLGQVVVGAEIEPGHLVGYAVARGEHDDRRVHAGLARGLEDAEAVALGQHDVEDDQIVGVAPEDKVQGGIAVGGRLHGVSLFLQPLPDEAQDLPIVLDHENTHGSPDSSYSHHARIGGSRRAIFRRSSTRRNSTGPCTLAAPPGRHACAGHGGRRDSLSLRDLDVLNACASATPATPVTTIDQLVGKWKGTVSVGPRVDPISLTIYPDRTLIAIWGSITARGT